MKRILPVYLPRSSPCYSGDEVGRPGCPARNDVPRFLFSLSRGDFRLAFDILKRTNPFSGGCGRFCDHPCESACNRARFDAPVDIMSLERAASDFGLEKGVLPEKRAQSSGKRIAVVGAGPAGLTTSYFLAMWGHQVIVFEREKKPGGLMRFGIPRYRYPEKVLDYEIDYVRGVGVSLEVGAEIGREELSDISRKFDAVVLATGALSGRRVGCPGDDLPGVIQGIEFLKRINFMAGDGEADVLLLKEKAGVGDKVAVLGGGYTAFDVARTAVRLGCDVTVYYRRTDAQMTAHPGEVEEARREGVGFVFLAIPERIELEEDSRLRVTFRKARLGSPDESGRARPIPTGETFIERFDTVITAIGEESTLSEMFEEFEFDPVNETLQTVLGGVGCTLFLAGDARKGLSDGTGMVVKAIGSGQDTAARVESYLTGRRVKFGVSENGTAYYDSIKTRYFDEKARGVLRSIPHESRKGNFREVAIPLTREEAVYLAGRCFFCGICIQCDWCFDYARGEIAKLRVPWNPDKDAVFYKFLADRVGENAERAVWSCPRNTMGFVSIDEDRLELVRKQYIGNPFEKKDSVG